MKKPTPLEELEQKQIEITQKVMELTSEFIENKAKIERLKKRSKKAPALSPIPKKTAKDRQDDREEILRRRESRRRLTG